MYNKQFIESSGKTIEEAISLGLEKLDLSISDVDVEIIDEGSKGLFGLFGSKLAKVKLTVKDNVSAQDMLNSINIKKTAKNLKEKTKSANELAQNNKKSIEVINNNVETTKAQITKEDTDSIDSSKNIIEEQDESAQVVSSSSIDKEVLMQKSKDFLTNITKYMGVNVDINPSFTDEETLFVDMHGDEYGILIGRHGETLEALQHITKLAVNKDNEQFVRILLDSENYRAKREESLVRLANRMANRAVKTGRRVSLEPMNPYERRVIHSALQKNNQVSTHSEGEEPHRHLVITVNKK